MRSIGDFISLRYVAGITVWFTVDRTLDNDPYGSTSGTHPISFMLYIVCFTLLYIVCFHKNFLEKKVRANKSMCGSSSKFYSCIVVFLIL